MQSLPWKSCPFCKQGHIVSFEFPWAVSVRPRHPWDTTVLGSQSPLHPAHGSKECIHSLSVYNLLYLGFKLQGTSSLRPQLGGKSRATRLKGAELHLMFVIRAVLEFSSLELLFCVLSDGKVQKRYFNTVFEEYIFLLTSTFTLDLQPSLTQTVQYKG